MKTLTNSAGLRMYMAYFEGGRHELAILAFAHDSAEAKKVSWPELHSLDDVSEYIHMRVNLLKSKTTADHLWAAGDQVKLAAGIAHAIDNPPGCEECCQWGSENENEIQANGNCRSCNYDYD